MPKQKRKRDVLAGLQFYLISICDIEDVRIFLSAFSRIRGYRLCPRADTT